MSVGTVQRELPLDDGRGVRWLRAIVENNWFKNFILACIVLNAITLGVDAHFGENNPWHHLIEQLDVVFLAIFTAEIVMEFLAKGPRTYFKDGWNWFDMIVVGISYLSMSAFSALRTLRVFRVLRLVSSVPQLRRVVEALIGATPGILAAAMILGVVFYIGAVMATILFGQTHKELFGDLGASGLTLFQLTQFDGWGDLVRDMDKTHPYAWTFFIAFAVLAAFAVMNLFIGVIVDAVQQVRSDELKEMTEQLEEDVASIEVTEKAIATSQQQALDHSRMILEEMRVIRAELQALKSKIGG